MALGGDWAGSRLLLAAIAGSSPADAALCCARAQCSVPDIGRARWACFAAAGRLLARARRRAGSLWLRWRRGAGWRLSGIAAAARGDG